MMPVLPLLLLSPHALGAGPSPLHPDVQLLDSEGRPVVEANTPVSPHRTCGGCHDTQYIAEHGYHFSVGADETGPLGEAESGRPWDFSPGLYGRWKPELYEMLEPGAEYGSSGWNAVMTPRHAGGGPGDPPVEPDCFLCHLDGADAEARRTALERGDPAWAATATLSATGLVAPSAAPVADGDGAGSDSPDRWRWSTALLGETATVGTDVLPLQAATSEACGQCHGTVWLDEEPARLQLEAWSTATKGQVFSPQRISDSAANIEGKDALSHPWDVHAARLLECTSCHHAPNNPAFYFEWDTTQPAHLLFDGRRLDVGAYLRQPNHQFAKGSATQGTVADRLDGTMRRCEHCHDAGSSHDWLPQRRAHFAALSCESCHVPRVHAPARAEIDWLFPTPEGEPREAWRGVEGDPRDPTSLITGFRPALLPRKTADGGLRLFPYNLTTAWYWVQEDPKRPVPLDTLRSALAPGGTWDPELRSALDRDGDGQVSETERAEPPEAALERARTLLQAAGVASPTIRSEIQPHGLHHGVVPGSAATRDCTVCHRTEGARTGAPVSVASHAPDGVLPHWVADANVMPAGRLRLGDRGEVEYVPDIRAAGMYAPGDSPMRWVDRLGILAVLGALLGATVHGGLRIAAWRRSDRHAPSPPSASEEPRS